MPAMAYVNGVYQPIEAATVSVEDRGFQFGDSVYEVVRAYGGKPFHLAAHLMRLEQSLQAVEIDLGRPARELAPAAIELLDRSGLGDAMIYIQVTRGVAPREHGIPRGLVPTVVMTCREVHPLPGAVREAGVAAVTLPDIRWAWGHIKSTSLLASVLLRARAQRQGAYEALLHRDGVIIEGTASNLFLVLRGGLVTPPAGEGVLPGVSRQLVLGICGELGLEVAERPVRLAELHAAEECFLTDTYSEVLGVVLVDGRPVGDGRVGPLTRRLYDRFQTLVTEAAGPG